MHDWMGSRTRGTTAASRRRLPWSVGVRTLAIVLSVGLSLASGGDPDDPPGEGFLDLGFELAPTDGTELEGLRSMAIAAERIDVVHRSDINDPGSEQVITLDGAPLTLVLDAQRQGTPLRLNRSLVPVGFITQIRLIERDTNAAFVDMNGAVESVKVPAGHRTGLKILPVNEPYEIVENEVTAVLAVFDPRRNVLRNQGVGFIFNRPLTGSLVDPDDLLIPNLSTPGTVVPGTTEERRRELEDIQLQEAASALVSTHTSVIGRSDVEAIVRGTVTALEPHAVVQPDGECEIATEVTMAVEESFLVPFGDTASFLMSGGALAQAPPDDACPQITDISNDARLEIGDQVQVVLFLTQRDDEFVLFGLGGSFGVTPLALDPSAPDALKDAVEEILTFTEDTYGI